MSHHRQMVALTGATGFIGRHITDALIQAGWNVKVLTRPGSSHRIPETDRIIRVKGDLGDEDCLEALVSGVQAVIHCAGVVRGVCRYDFDLVNVEGTSRLFDICSRCATPPRFLHISSLAARAPQLSYYAASKHKGESVITESEADISWTILRPPAVYGPGDRELLPLFKAMANGICPVPCGKTQRISLLHVYDLSNAVVCILKKIGTCNKIYELHDGQPRGYTWKGVAETVQKITGRRIIYIKIPNTIVKMLGLVNIGVSKMVGRAPMLTPGKVRELLHPDWTADNTQITKDTGWIPTVTLERGIRDLLSGAGL